MSRTFQGVMHDISATLKQLYKAKAAIVAPGSGTFGVHAVDGLFVIDCIASGTIWVDMVANGVDVLISAPQKGWSSSPCCALVMLSERARASIGGTTSTSFACDLRKWLQIMEAYESGG